MTGLRGVLRGDKLMSREGSMGEESSGQARLLKATYASTFRASFPAFPHMQTSRFLSTLYIFTLWSKSLSSGNHTQGTVYFPHRKQNLSPGC